MEHNNYIHVGEHARVLDHTVVRGYRGLVGRVGRIYDFKDDNVRIAVPGFGLLSLPHAAIIKVQEQTTWVDVPRPTTPCEFCGAACNVVAGEVCPYCGRIM